MYSDHHKAFELDVLCILPFDSNRKRMSIVIMDPATGIISLYCKGADSAMLPIISKGIILLLVNQGLLFYSIKFQIFYNCLNTELVAKDGITDMCVLM